MRFGTVLVVSFLAGIGTAETVDELEAKIGRFDGKGYTFASDVRLTVTHGTDHSACKLYLRSKKVAPNSGPQPNFDADVADRVISEIVPPSARKGGPRTTVAQMGCAVNTTEEYENVVIVRLTSECLPIRKDNVQSLTIRWKRRACE